MKYFETHTLYNVYRYKKSQFDYIFILFFILDTPVITKRASLPA